MRIGELVGMDDLRVSCHRVFLNIIARQNKNV